MPKDRSDCRQPRVIMLFKRKRERCTQKLNPEHFARKLNFLSSVCTGLPVDWTGVKTETEFPVDTDTTITVSCQEGYINTGSSVVTCNTYLYQDFEFARKPQCFKSGNVWRTT